MINIVEAKWGKFMVFPNDALGQRLMEEKDFEPHFYQLTKNVIKEGSICLDCGANLGYHTVCLSRQVGPSGKVVSFEPLRLIFQQLNGNVFLNNLRNVTCINAALGNANRYIQMDSVNFDASFVNIGGTKIGNGGDIVEMIKLDDVVTDGVDFVKIDVQGSEVMLLEGAQTLIKNSRPIMFVEVEENWLRCFGYSSETLLNKLLSMDYILVRIKNKYPCDHIAIPREKIGQMDNIIKDIDCPVSVIDGKSVRLIFDAENYRDVLYGTYEVVK